MIYDRYYATTAIDYIRGYYIEEVVNLVDNKTKHLEYINSMRRISELFEIYQIEIKARFTFISFLSMAYHFENMTRGFFAIGSDNFTITHTFKVEGEHVI